MALYVAAASIVALSATARSIMLLYALAKARQEDIPAIIRASARMQVHDAGQPATIQPRQKPARTQNAVP